MKTFSKAVLLFCALGLTLAVRVKSVQSKALDRYLESLSSNIVDTLIKKTKTDAPDEIVDRNLQLAAGSPPERKLSYESLTNSYLMGSSDDTSTTNHLSMLISQQKAMQNFRIVGNWLNDLEGNLDDLRDAVNRRVSDLATGLQRRNQLLGHYNYIGQGMNVGGAGIPYGGQ